MEREKNRRIPLWKNLLRDFHVAAVAVSCPSLFFSPPTNCVYLPLSLLLACISNEVSAIAGKYLQRSSKPRFLSRDGGRNKLRREIKATSWEPADQSTKTLPNLFSLLLRASIFYKARIAWVIQIKTTSNLNVEIFLQARNLFEMFFLSITSNPLNLKTLHC